MRDPFNPEKLSLAMPRTRQVTGTNPPRHKPGEKFLRGPIPWDWLARAARQPGKALHVTVALWFLAGVKRSRSVSLSGTVLRQLGVNRHSGYRGLTALEQAGLIRITRHAGRASVVTLLDATEDEQP